MSSLNIETLLVELTDAKNDSMKVLASIEAIHTALQGNSGQVQLADEYRKISIPMIYSSWESQFTSSTALCFRALKDINKSACDHTPNIRAVWLQQAKFFVSYIDMIKNIYDIDAHKTLSQKMSNMKRKVRKGHYKLTTDVLSSIDTFNSSRLDTDVNVDDLVMTFSNVNKVVTEMNMDVLGIDHSNLDLSKLDALVGLRNAFGHGQFTSRVGSRQFKDWLTYTRSLIEEFFLEIKSWLECLDLSLSESRRESWKVKGYTGVHDFSNFEYSKAP
ncbi:hypothetical protein MA790_002173 [Vibrio parahaemolyticus]|nr:hypothetical protein [Vibrio parahaemolyticus]